MSGPLGFIPSTEASSEEDTDSPAEGFSGPSGSVLQGISLADEKEVYDQLRGVYGHPVEQWLMLAGVGGAAVLGGVFDNVLAGVLPLCVYIFKRTT